MIVKQFKNEQFEIIVTKTEDNTYNVIMMAGNNKVEYHPNYINIEDALEIFDFLYDKLMGNDLKEWGFK